LAAIRSAARDDRLNASFAHDLGGHVVANQRDVDATLLQLPGRQACALEERAGFVGINVDTFADSTAAKITARAVP